MIRRLALALALAPTPLLAQHDPPAASVQIAAAVSPLPESFRAIMIE